MINNEKRIGNATSSQMFRVIGTPAVVRTYLQEKNLERKLNGSIETESYTQSMAWGNFLEQRVHELLGMDYLICSSETNLHPKYNFWAGSKDFIVEGVKISELKCYQVKNFALYTDALMTRDVEYIKAEFPKEYWQAVSNAIINEVPKAELITYCPYESELDEIIQMAIDYSDHDAWKYRFIYENKNLPCIKDGGYFTNLNRFEFTVPKEHIDFLTEKVISFGEKLNPFFKPE